MKINIAISIGDINGIGPAIALKAHNSIKKICNPIYFADYSLFEDAAKILKIDLPSNLSTVFLDLEHTINPARATKISGLYSYVSFIKSLEYIKKGKCNAVVTLPINKEAWKLADIQYKGHTELLREHYNTDAIMMLGCEKMFVALFTEHIPLKIVHKMVKKEPLVKFLINLQKEISAKKIAVLGLNPHAGDGGVLGNEEVEIKKAIEEANSMLGKKVFYGPMVPDIAFSPKVRESFKYFVAMYHDQGLAPLKALYFEESINISLNLPIIRTSVDHGTAYDIAYKDISTISTKSYIEAVKASVKLAKTKLSATRR